MKKKDLFAAWLQNRNYIFLSVPFFSRRFIAADSKYLLCVRSSALSSINVLYIIFLYILSGGRKWGKSELCQAIIGIERYGNILGVGEKKFFLYR